MAIPASIEARLFYRCAFERYEDAQVLLRAEHTTGAVYLAGYGVECILKALILSALAPAAQSQMLKFFRGTKAHDFEWLRTQYLEGGGPRFPREIVEAFTLVNPWSTDMRYLPGKQKVEEAEGFLDAAGNIIRWANGRI
jgi:HEPN domain-containing protein